MPVLFVETLCNSVENLYILLKPLFEVTLQKHLLICIPMKFFPWNLLCKYNTYLCMYVHWRLYSQVPKKLSKITEIINTHSRKKKSPNYATSSRRTKQMQKICKIKTEIYKQVYKYLHACRYKYRSASNNKKQLKQIAMKVPKKNYQKLIQLYL